MWLKMEVVPNPNVLEVANAYQEASDILSSHDESNTALRWVACINAAFAGELYIKSFLAEPDHASTGIVHNGRSIQFGASKAPKSHNLLKAFQDIDQNVRTDIENLSRELDADFDLLGSLEKCQDYFAQGRYSYEMTSLPDLDMVVVTLAAHLRKLAYRYLDGMYSVVAE